MVPALSVSVVGYLIMTDDLERICISDRLCPLLIVTGGSAPMDRLTFERWLRDSLLIALIGGAFLDLLRGRSLSPELPLLHVLV